MMDDIKLMKFTRMDTMHHLLSGFKAEFTAEAALCIDKCRLSTGGAGFAAHSGFAQIWNNTTPQVTWEGDNTVMLLQAAKFIFKMLKAKELLPFPFTYLSKMDELLQLKDQGKSVEQMHSFDLLEQALAVRAAI